MTSMSSKIQTLPRTLRRFLTLDASALPSAAPSLAPSASATRRDSPLPIGTLDELGAAVERKPPTPRATAASAAPQVLRAFRTVFRADRRSNRPGPLMRRDLCLQSRRARSSAPLSTRRRPASQPPRPSSPSHSTRQPPHPQRSDRQRQTFPRLASRSSDRGAKRRANSPRRGSPLLAFETRRRRARARVWRALTRRRRRSSPRRRRRSGREGTRLTRSLGRVGAQRRGLLFPLPLTVSCAHTSEGSRLDGVVSDVCWAKDRR